LGCTDWDDERLYWNTSSSSFPPSRGTWLETPFWFSPSTLPPFYGFIFLVTIALAKYSTLDIRVLWFLPPKYPDPPISVLVGSLILASTSDGPWNTASVLVDFVLLTAANSPVSSFFSLFPYQCAFPSVFLFSALFPWIALPPCLLWGVLKLGVFGLHGARSVFFLDCLLFFSLYFGAHYTIYSSHSDSLFAVRVDASRPIV
jgi:hypothetical protein